MKQFIFFLLIVVTCALGEEKDWNNQTDNALDCINNAFRERRIYNNYNGGILNDHVELNTFNVLGMDSLERTGNCTKKENNGTSVYDYHIGWSLLVFTFPSLVVDNQTMSAFLRVKNNSFHLTFITHDDPCNATIEKFEMEELSGVEFYSSVKEFDGMDLNETCKKNILPAINKKLLLLKLVFQMQLNNMLCNKNLRHEEAMVEIIMNI